MVTAHDQNFPEEQPSQVNSLSIPATAWDSSQCMCSDTALTETWTKMPNPRARVHVPQKERKPVLHISAVRQ